MKFYQKKHLVCIQKRYCYQKIYTNNNAYTTREMIYNNGICGR
jgi:hypothetical protein